MPIQTLDDIVENLADSIGVYGADERSRWVSALKTEIRDAVEIEKKLQEAHDREVMLDESDRAAYENPGA